MSLRLEYRYPEIASANQGSAMKQATGIGVQCSSITGLIDGLIVAVSRAFGSAHETTSPDSIDL